jgi:phenylacetate-coenzyme A ligase PaaK-like adenylate-forming protein
VRAILVAGEPGGNIPATRRRIEAAWGAQVVDHWGMTELGPLAIESLAEPGGLYLLETECIAEIIDPQTCQPVPPGTEALDIQLRRRPSLRFDSKIAGILRIYEVSLLRVSADRRL